MVEKMELLFLNLLMIFLTFSLVKTVKHPSKKDQSFLEIVDSFL